MHDAIGKLPDAVHLERESRFQQIALLSRGGHLALLLDGWLEVHSFDAHRIHEALALVPTLFRTPGSVRRVLVAGGGDGMCAEALLRLPEIERIVVCEIDDEITALARRHPMTLLNRDSLGDPRVELVHADVRRWLEETEERFDLVIGDLPAPRFRPLEELYTPAFFASLEQRLTSDGLLSLRVPFTPQLFAFVYRALQSVFPCVYPYRCPAQSVGTAGFLLGAHAPIVRSRPVAPGCRYLNERVVPVLFAFARDELRFLGEPEAEDAVSAMALDYGLEPEAPEDAPQPEPGWDVWDDEDEDDDEEMADAADAQTVRAVTNDREPHGHDATGQQPHG